MEAAKKATQATFTVPQSVQPVSDEAAPMAAIPTDDGAIEIDEGPELNPTLPEELDYQRGPP